jgi:hypothetical protein
VVEAVEEAVGVVRSLCFGSTTQLDALTPVTFRWATLDGEVIEQK